MEIVLTLPSINNILIDTAMTKNRNFAMLMLMSVAAAVTMTFTACSDELNDLGNKEQTAPEGADKSLLEAYGLTFENFINDNDVVILNADTTMLSVSKAYAEKMGISSFVNHPMGIWHKMNQLPYLRKGIAQKLDGDRYIVDVVPATVAELIGDKEVMLSTGIYVNADASSMPTRAADTGMPEYAAKYVDEQNVIHPAVIHLTDPYGYDNDWNLPDDRTIQTRSEVSGEYKYYTAEELASPVTRWGDRRRILSLNSTLEFDHKFECGVSPNDTIRVNGKIPVDFSLDYFITLNGGVKWHACIPEPYVKKFEAGLDGSFAFNPECYIGFSEKLGIPKEKQRVDLAKFKGYSFTFWLGPVPVLIQCNPVLFMKVIASVEGNVRIGFKYEYENEFRAGVRYENNKGWTNLSYFREKKNEFTFKRPELNFQANAGLGFFLGVDVVVYGVAGPTLSVGPSIEGKMNLTISPWAQDESKKYLLNASVDMKMQAVVGAKLAVMGYRLAEWNTSFNLAGPWNIYKYPSDGTEHKVGEKGGDPAVWEQFMTFVDKSSWGNSYRQTTMEIVEMMKEMYECDEAYARQTIFNYFVQRYNAPQFIESNCYGFYLDLCVYRDEIKERYKTWEYAQHVKNGDTEWIMAENWRSICEEIKANIKWNLGSVTMDEALEDIHKWFYNEFKREPIFSSDEDMEWIAMKYRDYAIWRWEYREQSDDSEENFDEEAYEEAKKKAEEEAKKKAEEKEKAKEAAEENWQKVLAILKDMHEDDFKNYNRQATKSANSSRKGFIEKYNREPTTSAFDIIKLDEMYVNVMSLHK